VAGVGGSQHGGRHLKRCHGVPDMPTPSFANDASFPRTLGADFAVITAQRRFRSSFTP
jgi:hypothetical protein